MKQTNTTTNIILTTDDGEIINGKYYADVYINDELVLDKIDMEENEIDFDSYIRDLATKYSITNNIIELTKNEKQLVETKLNAVLKAEMMRNIESIISSVIYGEVNNEYNVIEGIDLEKFSFIEDYIKQLIFGNKKNPIQQKYKIIK